MKTQNEFRVVEKPAVRIVGLHVRTNLANASANCGKLFGQFGPRMHEITDNGGGVSYGVSWMVGEREFDYWAALPVGADANVPEGMDSAEIPAGLYVEVPFASLEEIGRAYQRVFAEWLPSQREFVLRDDAPSFELYPADWEKTKRGSVFMPVRKT